MSNNIAFARTTQPTGRPPFIVDPSQIVRDTGRQIDWDALGDTFVENPQIIKLNGAAAAGAISLTVDALPVDLEPGDNLDFGTLEQVTVTAGATLVNATTLVVTALPGPIPSGTVLWFGTNKFAHTTADAAAGATSIAVTAIPVAFAGGETATFEGGVLTAVVDAHADAGATTVVVEDLPLTIPDNAEAVVRGEIGGEVTTGRHLVAGTVLDLQADGTVVPSSLGTGGLTAYGILETNADEDSRTDAATGYGVIKSGSFYENLLPEADGNTPSVINSTWKTELLARGGFWLFEQYSDNT
jgi:hypothetical protein